MTTIYHTVDHRFGDAANLINFYPILKAYFLDPENFNTKDYKY